MKKEKFNLEVHHDSFNPCYYDALVPGEDVYMACDKAVTYSRISLSKPDEVDVFIERYDGKFEPIYVGKVRIGVTHARSVYHMYTMVMDKIEELRGW